MTPFHETVVPLRRPAPVATVQGTLALDVHGVTGEAHDPPPLATTGSPPRGERDRLELWARRFTQAAVEIVGGDRPVTQLLRWVSPTVYEDLDRRAQLVRAAVAREGRPGRVQAVRPQVESVHTCWVSGAVVEACARVRYGHRCRAVAVRFEHRNERWQAVALEFA